MNNLKIPYCKLSFLKSPWAKGLFCFLVVLGVISQLSQYVGLVYSQTDSLPYHLFLHLKQVEPQRGHYTCFNSPWYGRQVIKKVSGMGGDVLVYDKESNLWVQAVTVNGFWLMRQLKIGKHKKHAKDGRALTPIKPGRISKGMVFVSGYQTETR